MPVQIDSARAFHLSSAAEEYRDGELWLIVALQAYFGATVFPLLRRSKRHYMNKDSVDSVNGKLKMKSTVFPNTSGFHKLLIAAFWLFQLSGLTKITSHAATVQVSGTVNSGASVLTVGSPASLNNAQLTAGVTDFALVTVNERCNKKTGYTVTLWPANSGSGSVCKLSGSTSGETITYTLKYGGTPVSLVQGKAVVTDVADKTGNSGVNKVLSISVPAGFPAADTYNDTITIILATK